MITIRATFSDEGVPTGFYPSDIWPTDFPAHAVIITEQQWTELLGNPGTRKFINGKVVEFAPSVDLVAYASNKRWEKETGGIEIDGAIIDTSVESQNRINGAYNYALENPAKNVSFKAASGWVQLSAEEMIAIGRAVGDHVQGMFALERAIAAEIASGTITTVEQIDAAFA